MKHLQDLLATVKTRNFKITTTKSGAEKLQQTESNAFKKEIMDAIAQDIAEVTPYIYRAEKGYLLEIANDSVADGITNETGSGAITVEINCVIKGLDCNAEDECECYSDKQAEKAEKAAEKAKAKARKIAEDTAKRKAKKDGE